jgi:DNA-binding Lrp family transcriptional regulator
MNKLELIIKNLESSEKIQFSRVAERLGMTRQAFHYRFNELKASGIIKNFTINVHPYLNPSAMKYIIVEIKTNPKEPELISELIQITNLNTLDGLFGEFSLLALLKFETIEVYYEILNKIDQIMAKSYFKKYKIIDIIKIYKVNGIMLSDHKVDQVLDLDDNDYRILKILRDHQNSKPISTYEIKDKMKRYYKKNISQPTIYNRIKVMEDARIILNYAINFDPRKIGYLGKFIIRIKPSDPSKYELLARKLEQMNYITDLFRIGEQFGLFGIIRVRNVEDYQVVIKNLYEEEIEDTFTNFVLDERICYTNFKIN